MITGSINLASLHYVVMEKRGQSGMVKGLFIPIEKNHLQEHSSGGVYLNVVAFEMKEPKDYATHIVKQSFTKKEREALGEDVIKELPILGNLKTTANAPAAVDNDAGDGKVFDAETDDLPF